MNLAHGMTRRENLDQPHMSTTVSEQVFNTCAQTKGPPSPRQRPLSRHIIPDAPSIKRKVIGPTRERTHTAPTNGSTPPEGKGHFVARRASSYRHTLNAQDAPRERKPLSSIIRRSVTSRFLVKLRNVGTRPSASFGVKFGIIVGKVVARLLKLKR